MKERKKDALKSEDNKILLYKQLQLAFIFTLTPHIQEHAQTPQNARFNTTRISNVDTTINIL